MKKFYASKDLALFLEVSEPTIYNWRRAGMPSKEVALNRYEYDLQDVTRWLSRKSERHKRFVQRLLNRLNAEMK